jgi:hypothetical protein
MAWSSLGPIPAGNRYASHRYSPGKAEAIQVTQFALPPHATPMRNRVRHIARIPPRLQLTIAWLQTGTHHRQQSYWRI